MRVRSLCWIPLMAAACPSPHVVADGGVVLPDGGLQVTCLPSTPAAALYSGECSPPQTGAFCWFTENTDF